MAEFIALAERACTGTFGFGIIFYLLFDSSIQNYEESFAFVCDER
jgi:hypothetical protein